ncbi:hypothetical protein HYQ46_005010 [Verticillium longisporum]|nr:hypothetical protein HYQ46_005010 [Verticillium longisporum]
MPMPQFMQPPVHIHCGETYARGSTASNQISTEHMVTWITRDLTVDSAVAQALGPYQSPSDRDLSPLSEHRWRGRQAT